MPWRRRWCGGRMLDFDRLHQRSIWNSPWFRAVCQIAVRKHASPASCSERQSPRLLERSQNNLPGFGPPRPASGIRHCDRRVPAANRPVRSWSADPCSGPPRCTLMTSIGSSVITANPIASCLSAMPGPLDAVTPIGPPNAAPMADVMAAISSSA